jgi:hypothetical protein
MHSPELSAAMASLHGGRLDFVRRNTMVNTTVAMAALVMVGAVVNLPFIAVASRLLPPGGGTLCPA